MIDETKILIKDLINTIYNRKLKFYKLIRFIDDQKQYAYLVNFCTADIKDTT